MSDLNDFFIRERASLGVKMPLSLPSGEPSEHHLMVVSQWSDEFQGAQDRAIQEVAKAVSEKRLDLEQLTKEQRLRTLAGAVKGWSFPQDCTPDAVMELLRNAPQIVKQLDRFVGRDSNFFSSGSTNSSPGPSPSSPSGESLPEASSP